MPQLSNSGWLILMYRKNSLQNLDARSMTAESESLTASDDGLSYLNTYNAYVYVKKDNFSLKFMAERCKFQISIVSLFKYSAQIQRGEVRKEILN